MPTQEMRCNGDIVKSDEGLCSVVEGSFLNPTNLAGYSCQGGTYNEKDSNDGTSEKQCIAGGGTWSAYDCGDADDYLQSKTGFAADAQTRQYLKEYWWAPKCCIGGESGISSDSSDETESEVSTPDEADLSTVNTNSSSSSNAGAIAGGIVGALAVVAVVSFFILKKKRSSNMDKSQDIAATRRETMFANNEMDNI